MAEIKYMGYESLTEYDALIKAYIDGKIFIGTYSEYQTAYANNKIAIGAIVIITDDENNSSSISTSSLLGTGVLGYMILG